ncbi:MAG: ABC transporter substrate-binding protein [Alphaproteobacteria bacterium]|nr:ABC transporter substrate-binding protein [Alphaproteobacteria bacterium]MCW5740848.1 ABC transporter substrate-binding protein [Alphaproteobacteria bacterium]
MSASILLPRRRALIAAAGAPLLLIGRGAMAGVRVKDARGHEVEIKDASRIVAVGGSVTEVIYALGGERNLVATDSTSLFPAAAQKTPKVGYMRQLSAEGLLSLRPSVVITTTAAGPEAALRQIADAGVAVLVLSDDYSFDAVIAKIEGIGRALGLDKAAADLVTRVRTDMADLSARIVRSKAKPRVLSFLTFGQGGAPQAAGRMTAADGIIRLAGGINVFDAWSGYKPMTPEATVAAAPEVIMLGTQTIETVGGIDKVLADPALALTPAAKNKRVASADALLLLGFGPRTAEAVRIVARVFHPDIEFPARQ